MVGERNEFLFKDFFNLIVTQSNVEVQNFSPQVNQPMCIKILVKNTCPYRFYRIVFKIAAQRVFSQKSTEFLKFFKPEECRVFFDD